MEFAVQMTWNDSKLIERWYLVCDKLCVYHSKSNFQYKNQIRLEVAFERFSNQFRINDRNAKKKLPNNSLMALPFDSILIKLWRRCESTVWNGCICVESGEFTTITFKTLLKHFVSFILFEFKPGKWKYVAPDDIETFVTHSNYVDSTIFKLIFEFVSRSRRIM